MDSPSVGMPVRLVVDIDQASGTKATGLTSNDEASEAKISSLQVFVFNGDMLDGYSSSTGRTAVVSCTSGERTIVAVANADDLSDVSSKAVLALKTCGLGSTTDNFTMVGTKTLSLDADETIHIDVERRAARVVLKAVKNALSVPSQAASFSILSVYLTNVAGDALLLNSGGMAVYVVQKWYNRRGYESQNSIDGVIYDSVGKTVDSGDTLSEAHFFYCLPNAGTAAVGGPWSPRATMLVIKAQIDGAVYDYPITLPPLYANRSYEIELVNITRLGNVDNGSEPVADGDTDEESPIEGVAQSLSVSSLNWDVTVVSGNGVVNI